MVSLAEVMMMIALVPVGTVLFVLYMMSWRWRHHVWADIELDQGKSPVKRYRPDDDGWLHTKWGDYATDAHAFTIRKRLPLFRYRQGDPFPIIYDKKKVVSDNPGKGKVIYIANPQRVAIPATAMAVFMKQKTFEQIYASKFGIMLLLVLGMAIIGLLVIGLYLRVG